MDLNNECRVFREENPHTHTSVIMRYSETSVLSELELDR